MPKPTADVTATAPSMPRLESDPTSPFCLDVLSLYRGPLAAVSFPDADRGALDRARLDGESAALLEAQREVEELERSLEAARARVREASATLHASCARGLAYARVFATGRSDVEAAVDAVRSGDGGADADSRGGSRVQRKRRARDQSTGELPIETSLQVISPDANSPDANSPDANSPDAGAMEAAAAE